jgi:hypothetical protein
MYRIGDNGTYDVNVYTILHLQVQAASNDTSEEPYFDRSFYFRRHGQLLRSTLSVIHGGLQERAMPATIRLMSRAHPETASCGSARCSRSIEILDVAPLRLRFQPRCGLDPNPNLPFLDEQDFLPNPECWRSASAHPDTFIAAGCKDCIQTGIAKI